MRRRPGAAALAMLLGAAQAAGAQPVTVAQSARLGIEVQAPGAGWCALQPELQVIVPDTQVFASPEFAALVARLGPGLAAGCPQVRAILLTGQVRGSAGEAAWHGTADAASGWAVRVVAPAAAPAAGVAQALPSTPAQHLDAAGPEASAGPSMLPPGPPVRLDAAGLARAVSALGSAPGRIDTRRGCWAATARDAAGVTSGCLRIVRGFNAAGPNGDQVFLLLTGKGTTDCHACAGLIAFAVLDAAGPDWRITVPPVPATNGAYGQPTGPAAFAFVQLGRDRWGWIEKHSGVGQGVVEGGHTIHMLRGPAFVEVGLLPGERDNSGACGDPGDPITSPSCMTIESIDVTAAPDVSRPDAAAYPILLHATGSVFQAGKGSRRIDKRAVARFDETRFQYVAPLAWP
jgi:hypothetical protein